MVCYMCGKNNRIHLIFGPIEFVGVLRINSIIFEVESCEECNLFHQDSSAAPETQNSVVALRNTFADPIISPPLWPVRSLDLMKRDCYLRRRLKDSIYASNLHTHTHTQRERTNENKSSGMQYRQFLDKNFDKNLLKFQQV